MLKDLVVLEGDHCDAAEVIEELQRREKDEMYGRIARSVQQDKSTEDVTCARALGEYLKDVAAQVNVRAFETFTLYVKLLWICLNTCGCESEELSNGEFVECKSAEEIPEICNYFCKEFICKESTMDQRLSINLTLHFCDWMYRKKYSHTKVVLA